MIIKRIAWLGLLAAVGLGCEASNPDGLAEPLAEAPQESAWSAGCYWDCPPCNGANCGICAMVCPGGAYCGDRRCEVDEVCCSEACGLCAKPGESCERTACLQPPECSKDSDCSVEADYCVDCDCAAVGPEEHIPACPGPGVQCFKDPCIGRKAVCLNQRCVME
jgi:hypothetical protein